MRIIVTKGERGDRIEAHRADGSSVSTTFPHKGPIPHDLVHLFVESELGIVDGFWGMVAAGRHPEDIAMLAKESGHASAKRASTPQPEIVGIVQAERAVECFEADLWGGSGADGNTLRQVIAAGCAQSLVPPVDVPDDAIDRIRLRLRDLRDRWAGIRLGEALSFDWAMTAA